MAYEKSEPRNNQILLWGVVSVLTLFALIPLFHGYFADVFGEEFGEKIYAVPNTPYQELRDTQRGHLRSGGVTIDQAMQTLATRGRAGTPVMPRPNDAPDLSEEDYEASLAPVTGWAQLQDERRAEAARRAMQWRRQALQADAPPALEGSSLERVEREGADAPSAVVEDRPAVVPAEQPVRPGPPRIRPPAQLMRPTAMVAGGASAMAAPSP